MIIIGRIQKVTVINDFIIKYNNKYKKAETMIGLNIFLSKILVLLNVYSFIDLIMFMDTTENIDANAAPIIPWVGISIAFKHTFIIAETNVANIKNFVFPKAVKVAPLGPIVLFIK